MKWVRTNILLFAGALAVPACVERAPTELEEIVADCSAGEVLTLAPGQFRTSNGPSARFCVGGPQNATYLVMPFIAGSRDTLNRVTVKVFGGGTISPTPATRPAVEVVGRSERDLLMEGSDALHALLRARESLEHGHQIRGHVFAQRDPLVPGDIVNLNASANCDLISIRAGRVVAITSQAVVVADTVNPRAGAFTNEQLRQFGIEFDDLVHPVITQNFGANTDIDGNHRIVLFFTRAVNEIPIAGSPGALAGGFFFRGDLFPREGIPGRSTACAGSNQGEVLYLAVPDSLGEARVPISRATLAQTTSATIGHEFQHLINTGRKLHVVNAPTLEESWLNEGLSFIAEELLFYAASGMSARANIDTAAIYDNHQTVAFNKFMYGNMGRLNIFVQAPQDWSALGRDALATRGATWSFLRYIADRDARPDAQLFRALIDGVTPGLANVETALGRDPMPWMADWAVSLFADDYVGQMDQRFVQPSWNARELIAALRVPNRNYPLRLLPITASAGFSVRLMTGSSAYPVFSVPAGERAVILIEAEGMTSEQHMMVTLLRVR